jgi:hypothetical protein
MGVSRQVEDRFDGIWLSEVSWRQGRHILADFVLQLILRWLTYNHTGDAVQYRLRTSHPRKTKQGSREVMELGLEMEIVRFAKKFGNT